MKLPLTTVFAARTSDGPAAFALSVVETTLHPRVVERLAPGKSAPPGSVALLTTRGNEVQYSSRNIRVVASAAPEGTRTHHERMRLISLYPWLVPAATIVCLNPVRLNGDTGVWVDRGREQNLQALICALRGLCGDFPKRNDPLAHLNPQQKAARRILARRLERQEERILGC